jgi:hypothetical protein
MTVLVEEPDGNKLLALWRSIKVNKIASLTELLPPRRALVLGIARATERITAHQLSHLDCSTRGHSEGMRLGRMEKLECWTLLQKVGFFRVPHFPHIVSSPKVLPSPYDR